MFVARYLDAHTNIGGDRPKAAVKSVAQSHESVREFLEAWLPTRPTPEEVAWRVHGHERFEAAREAIADELGRRFATTKREEKSWIREKARIRGTRHYDEDMLPLLSPVAASTVASEKSLDEQLEAKQAELGEAQRRLQEAVDRAREGAQREYIAVKGVIDDDIAPASQALKRYWCEVEERTRARAERIQADSGMSRSMDTAMATMEYTDKAATLVEKTEKMRGVPQQLSVAVGVAEKAKIVDVFVEQASSYVTQASSVAPRLRHVVCDRVGIVLEGCREVLSKQLENLVARSWEWMMSTVTVESLSHPRSPPIAAGDVIGLVRLIDKVQDLDEQQQQQCGMSEDTTTVSWAFEALTKRLLEQRFMYHFAREGASTNRLDRPEWATRRFLDVWRHSETVYDRWLKEATVEDAVELRGQLDINFSKVLGKYFWDTRWPLVLDSPQLFAHHLSQYLGTITEVGEFAGDDAAQELIRSLTESSVLLQAWASGDLSACSMALQQVDSPWASDRSCATLNRLATTLMDLVENESVSRTSYLAKNSTAMAFFADAMYWPLIEQFVTMEKQKWNDLPTLHGEDEPTARLIQKSIEGVSSWITGGLENEMLRSLLAEHIAELEELALKMAKMIEEECGE